MEKDGGDGVVAWWRVERVYGGHPIDRGTMRQETHRLSHDARNMQSDSSLTSRLCTNPVRSMCVVRGLIHESWCIHWSFVGRGKAISNSDCRARIKARPSERASKIRIPSPICPKSSNCP